MNFSKLFVLIALPFLSLPQEDGIKKNVSFDRDLETSYSEKVSKQASNPELLPVGTMAPAWKLQNSEGLTRKLSDFKGKIVVMDFWATWCGPCIESQPTLQGIQEKYKNVVVLGMDFNDQQNVDLNKYKLRKKISYEMILNAEKIGAFYKVVGLPTVYVIDKSGKIVYSGLGYSEKSENELATIIEQVDK